MRSWTASPRLCPAPIRTRSGRWLVSPWTGASMARRGGGSDRRRVVREVRVPRTSPRHGGVGASTALRHADGPSDAEVGRVLGETARHVAAFLLRTELEEEKSAHSLLRHSERLATISTLASNLAHDLNDPLATVSGFAELLKKEPEISERGKKDLERISSASRHAQDIVRCLLLLARGSASEPPLLSLNRVVQEAISLVEHRCASATWRSRRDLDGQLPRIQGDPVQLCQVVINLMRNAVQAMPDGGKLTLSHRHRRRARDTYRARHRRRDERRDPQAYLRSILHYQERCRRHGPGPGDRSRRGVAPRWGRGSAKRSRRRALA